MSRPMWAVVSWTPPGASARRCTFTGTCTVGRDPENRIILPFSGVSRRHLRLEAGLHGLVVHNVSRSVPVPLGDGTTLAPGADRRIGPGDVLKLDGCDLVVLDVLDREPGAESVCANATCRRKVPAGVRDCPWCGVSLAFADTLPDRPR